MIIQTIIFLFHKVVIVSIVNFLVEIHIYIS